MNDFTFLSYIGIKIQCHILYQFVKLNSVNFHSVLIVFFIIFVLTRLQVANATHLAFIDKYIWNLHTLCIVENIRNHNHTCIEYMYRMTTVIHVY